MQKPCKNPAITCNNLPHALTLGEGIAAVRASEWISHAEVSAVVDALDTPARRLLSTPRRVCKGRRCPLTTPRWWSDGNGCKCEPAVLALRLVALARKVGP